MLLLSDILNSPLPDETKDIRAIINAQRLYTSCIDENGIEKEGVTMIFNIVNDQLGGWPILQGSSWDPSTFNLSRLMTKIREFSQNIIFSFGTSIDDRNSSAYYIRVSEENELKTMIQDDILLARPKRFSAG